MLGRTRNRHKSKVIKKMNHPQYIRIETTNVCNLKCKMCFHSTENDKKFKKGFIEKALFEKIVDQLVKYPETKNAYFALHIGGEPLLHKDIMHFIKYSRRNGFKPVLVTNGTLLAAEKSEELIRAGLFKIEFSFEGFDKETYESYRVGSDFGKVGANVDNFLELNKKYGKPVKTELVVVDLPNVSEEKKKKFISEMEKKGFDKINLSGFFDWLGKIDSPEKNLEGEYRGCNVLDSDLNILFDGTVVPCCMDVYGELPLGNFNSMTYEEIRESEASQKLRNQLKSGELDGLICEKCLNPWGGRK